MLLLKVLAVVSSALVVVDVVDGVGCCFFGVGRC